MHRRSVLILVTLTALLQAVPAYAADDTEDAPPATSDRLLPLPSNPLGLAGNETGGDIATGPAMAVVPGSRNALRQRLAAEIAAHVTTVDGALAAGRQAGLTRQELTTMAATTTAITYPTLKTLNVPQVAQINGYYCGPATGYMILKHAGYTTSRYDGVALSQSALATNTYMRTNTNGATTWASQDMITALNRWSNLGGSTRYMYLQKGQPTIAQVQFAAQYRIGYNTMAFAGSTVEYLNGSHYNGHPNRLIGHWITGFAYTSSGASISWADPATSVFPNAKPTFVAATSSFQMYLATNGVAY